MNTVEVVITGIGVQLTNCHERHTLWQHLKCGASQLQFDTNPASSTDPCAMGRIRSFNPKQHLPNVPERFYRHYPREVQLLLGALLAAKNDAALDVEAADRTRLGLFDGTARGNFGHWMERLQSDAAFGTADLMFATPGQAVNIGAALLKTQGPSYTFGNSCSAGAVAIGHAYREVASGLLDVAFAGGHDCPLVAPIYEMYGNAGLLSHEREDPRRAVQPFVNHSGNAFGEGAVILVMERRPHAEARGATILATVAGYAYGNNGAHPTHVDLSGKRPAAVARQALATEAIDLERLRFIVGHGNGVMDGDTCDINCARELLGPRVRDVPLLSNKPIYGHTFGASSALNVAAAALMIHHKFIVPTINIPDHAPLNHQATIGQQDPCEVGLCLSYGIGGHNTAVVLRRP